MLIVMTSDLSAAGPVGAGDPPPLPVAKASSGAVPPTPPPAGGALVVHGSAISALVIGESHRLAANGEVPSKWPADVILRQQDPGQVRVPPERDPEEVVRLPLLELGGRKQLRAGVDFRKLLSRGWRGRGYHPRGSFSYRRGWWVPCRDRTRG